MLFNRDELLEMGVKSLGNNVKIHKSVCIINANYLCIDDNTRIDYSCLLSCGKDGIFIGKHCHIAAGCYLFGSNGKITLEDFSGISARSVLYTGTDDFSDGFLTGPTIPDSYRKVTQGNITLKKHVVVGTNSTILPNVIIHIGATVGAMSLVKKDVDEWQVVAGNPLKFIRYREKEKLLSLESQFLSEKIT